MRIFIQAISIIVLIISLIMCLSSINKLDKYVNEKRYLVQNTELRLTYNEAIKNNIYVSKSEQISFELIKNDLEKDTKFKLVLFGISFVFVIFAFGIRDTLKAIISSI